MSGGDRTRGDVDVPALYCRLLSMHYITWDVLAHYIACCTWYSPVQ
jgi:hypothetical protein